MLEVTFVTPKLCVAALNLWPNVTDAVRECLEMQVVPIPFTT